MQPHWLPTKANFTSINSTSDALILPYWDESSKPGLIFDHD